MANLWLGLAMLLWGSAYFIVKLAFNSGVPPDSLNMLQTVGMIGVVVMTTSMSSVIAIPSVSPLALFLAVLRGAMLSLGGYCFNVASQVPGAQMSILTAAASQYPIVTLFLCTLLLGEVLTFYKILGVVFGLISMMCFLRS